MYVCNNSFYLCVKQKTIRCWVNDGLVSQGGLGNLWPCPCQLYLEAIMLYNMAICSSHWFKSPIMRHSHAWWLPVHIWTRARLMDTLKIKCADLFPFRIKIVIKKSVKINMFVCCVRFLLFVMTACMPVRCCRREKRTCSQRRWRAEVLLFLGHTVTCNVGVCACDTCSLRQDIWIHQAAGRR